MSEEERDFAQAWAAAEKKAEAGVSSGEIKELAPDTEKTVPAIEGDGKTETQEEKTEKLEQLKALATELGMRIDDGELTTKEKAQFRIAKKRTEQAIAEKTAEIEAAYNQKLSMFERDIKDAHAFRIAIENGDYDAIAQVAGYKDFSDMAINHVRKGTDPALAEVQQLKRQLAQREERARLEQQQAQQIAQQRAQAQAEAQWLENLQTELESSEDPAIAGFATSEEDSANFRAMVLNVQKESWDGTNYLSAEEAAKVVIGQIRSAYARSASIFNQSRGIAAEGDTTSRIGESRSRKAPRNIHQNEAVQASGSGGDMSTDDRIKRYSALLAQSSKLV